MKCDTCQCEFEGPAVVTTRSVQSADPHTSRTVRIKICPACAESRRGLTRFVFLAFCLAFGLLGIVSFFLGWQSR